MRVAVFTVPISRARAVRDGRWVGVRRVTGSQVGRRRWTFRHLRLWNCTTWRSTRRSGFRRSGASGTTAAVDLAMDAQLVGRGADGGAGAPPGADKPPPGGVGPPGGLCGDAVVVEPPSKMIPSRW